MKYKKWTMLFLCVLVCLGLLAGCSGGVDTQESPGANQGEQPETEDQGTETTPQDNEEPSGYPETAAYDFEGNVIRLRGYDAAPDEIKEYEYPIPEGETGELSTVLEAYNATYVEPVLGSPAIRANSITLTDGLLTLDFDQSIYGNYGSTTELHLLNHLFYAFFENIPEIDNICISVDGAPYESGHIMYRTDELISRDSVYTEG